MGNINSYAKFAKYSLAALWAVFGLSVVTVVLCHNLGFTGRLQSSASLLCVVLGLPLLLTIQYFLDVVAKVSTEYQVTLSKDVRQRLAPLAAHLHSEVLIGSYPGNEANAFAISSVFGSKALIAFSSQLLKVADDQQLMAIAAHEIAHLKNGDSRNKAFILAFSHVVRVYPHILSELSKSLLKNVAIVLLGMGALLLLLVLIFPEVGTQLNGWQSVFQAFLPVLAWPVGVILAYFTLNHLLNRAYFAYSREREFAADADGAALTSRQKMISALSLLAESEEGAISVFDTHPPLQDRKKRLAG
ncbi:M48 family metalloprotease [Duganella sp. HH101]|uniref:M48 family metalloprotease n=1 Tax=Duganella sp. HH101 TaxID=1781066 RepID=UPI0008735A42|nr:M48 family metalloprotease [Duganella sp. HH101]OEZ98154.1 protease HtpX [Duganella sp. HH101]